MPTEQPTISIDGQSFRLAPSEPRGRQIVEIIAPRLDLSAYKWPRPSLRVSNPVVLEDELDELASHLRTLLHEHKRLNSPRAFTRDLQHALIDVQARQRAYRARVAQRVQGAV